jgi:hypothetical protein
MHISLRAVPNDVLAMRTPWAFRVSGCDVPIAWAPPSRVTGRTIAEVSGLMRTEGAVLNAFA